MGHRFERHIRSTQGASPPRCRLGRSSSRSEADPTSRHNRPGSAACVCKTPHGGGTSPLRTFRRCGSPARRLDRPNSAPARQPRHRTLVRGRVMSPSRTTRLLASCVAVPVASWRDASTILTVHSARPSRRVARDDHADFRGGYARNVHSLRCYCIRCERCSSEITVRYLVELERRRDRIGQSQRRLYRSRRRWSGDDHGDGSGQERQCIGYRARRAALNRVG